MKNSWLSARLTSAVSEKVLAPARAPACAGHVRLSQLWIAQQLGLASRRAQPNTLVTCLSASCSRLAGEEEAIPVLSRLPWEGLGASDRAREAAGEVKAAVLAFSDDRAT